MDQKRIVIFGVGALAKLAYFYFTHDQAYDIVAFSVHRQHLQTPLFLGLPVVAFEDLEHVYPPAGYGMFVAIGYKTMRLRSRLYQAATDKGYRCVNYISQNAILYDHIELGDNNFIMPHVHLEPFVKIGHNNIFWSDSLVCHESTIGNHNFIAAKVQIGGLCTVGDLCFIGFDATLIQQVTLADESLIGAKSLILHSTVPYGKYVGTPARQVGEHREYGIRISDPDDRSAT